MIGSEGEKEVGTEEPTWQFGTLSTLTCHGTETRSFSKTLYRNRQRRTLGTNTGQ